MPIVLGPLADLISIAFVIGVSTCFEIESEMGCLQQ